MLDFFQKASIFQNKTSFFSNGANIFRPNVTFFFSFWLKIGLFRPFYTIISLFFVLFGLFTGNSGLSSGM